MQALTGERAGSFEPTLSVRRLGADAPIDLRYRMSEPNVFDDEGAAATHAFGFAMTWIEQDARITSHQA